MIGRRDVGEKGERLRPRVQFLNNEEKGDVGEVRTLGIGWGVLLIIFGCCEVFLGRRGGVRGGSWGSLIRRHDVGITRWWRGSVAGSSAAHVKRRGNRVRGVQMGGFRCNVSISQQASSLCLSSYRGSLC